MEHRKAISEIKMERSPVSILYSQIAEEITQKENGGFFSALLSLLMCALFSSTHAVFGVFPLGFAYLCMCRKRVLWAMLGCIIGTVSMGQAGIVYTIVYIFIFLVRAYISAPLERRAVFPICESYFCEYVQLRISLLLLVGLFLSLYQLLLFNMTKTGLFFALGMLCLPLLCALLMMGVTDGGVSWSDIISSKKQPFERKRENGTSFHPIYVQLGLIFICVCLCYSLSSITVFGLDMDYIFATFCTLFVSRRFGALRSCIVGCACALTLNILYAPSFCFLELISGILWQFGSFYAFTVGAAASVGWAGYAGGVGGFVELAPEVCVTSLLFMPFFSYLPSQVEESKKEEKRAELREHSVSLARPEKTCDYSFYLSSALAGVSNIFFSAPDTLLPTKSEYFELCEQVCEKKCGQCEKKPECWDFGERIAYDTVCKISDSLYQHGTVKKQSLPSEIFSVCEDFRALTDEMLTRASELSLCKIKGDKTRFISLDYAMLSKLIQKSARIEKREQSEDEATCNALSSVCRELCGDDVCVSVFGGRKKSIALSTHKSDILRKNASALHARMSEVCGCPLSALEFCNSGGIYSAKAHTERKFDIEYAVASAPSGSGEISGDMAKCFSSRDGLFYGILSDGMGTGDVAATTSGVCVSFLEKMLRAGAGKSLSLHMLNNIIRGKDRECSSTIDMLEIDLIYGKTTFLKCGAAPSFVKRGENISVIRANTTPLGLLRSTDAQKSDFSLRSGDIIALVSDGVIACDDGEWLISALCGDIPSDLNSLANELVVLAGQKNNCRDDATVVLIRVKQR